MKKDNVIYVVTGGEYSEYHIVGVFESSEKALAKAKSVGGRVEPYHLLDDNIKIADKMSIVYKFHVCFYHTTRDEYGFYIYTEGQTDVDYEINFPKNIEFNKMVLIESVNQRKRPIYDVYLKSYDTDLLNKIVQDEFAKWKAEQEGIT